MLSSYFRPAISVIFVGCTICLSSCVKSHLSLPAAPAGPPTQGPELDRDDAYEQAAGFYLLKRAPDGINLPTERYLVAKRHAELMPRSALGPRAGAGGKKLRDEQGATSSGWTPLGPGNIGGRTRSLIINPVNPSIMYAGAVSGGIWKTTDGGNSWIPLTDMLPSIGISSLAFDPANPDTIYAGTGEWFTSGSTTGNTVRGLGIFQSTDAGATWTQLPGTNNSHFYYVNKVIVSPHDSNRIYAATYGGVWTSPDAGVTWTETLVRASPNTGCQDLVMRTDQPTDVLFAACGTVANPGSAIFRNLDAAGGAKWESVFAPVNMGRTSLALAPSNQGIIYAVSSSTESGNFSGGLLGVYRSMSNGDDGSWETRASNTDSNRVNTTLLSNPREMFVDTCSGGKTTYVNQGGYDISIAVDPTDPNRVWAGGVDLFRSDDGGANWGIAMFWERPAPQGAHADNHTIVFHPNYDGSSNQTLYNTSDGGVYMTENANDPVATGARAACSPYPTQVAWKSLNNGYTAIQFYAGAVYPGGASYFGGTQDNGTPRGSDGMGANSWSTLWAGDGGVVAIDPNNANVIYVENYTLSLYKSIDGGASFSPAINGITGPSSDFLFIVPYVMDPSQSARLYLGGRRLWRTSDGAANWSAASSALPSTRGLITAVAVSPADPNHVLFGTVQGYIYSSSSALAADGSTDWQSAQPRTGYLSGLSFDPTDPNTAYATYSQFITNSSQNHVYKTTDGGMTWTGIDGSGDAAMPDIPVFSPMVDPQNPATVYLGTDIGMFFSQDGGNTWARDSNPFANAVTETLVLDRSAGATNLFAFTHGRGVWRTALPGSGSPCQYSVPGDALSFNAIGGTVAIPVTTGDGCSWTVTTGAGVALSTPANGSGSGTFAVSMPVNTSTAARSSGISVQGQAISISQAGGQTVTNNDDISSARGIVTLPYVGLEDTRRYNVTSADPLHSCTGSSDFKTVWWTVTAPATGTMTVSVQSERYDVYGNAGAVVTGYPLVNGSIGGELGCLAIPRGTGSWDMQSVPFQVTQGTTYAIEVSATGGTANDGGYTILTVAMKP